MVTLKDIESQLGLKFSSKDGELIAKRENKKIAKSEVDLAMFAIQKAYSLPEPLEFINQQLVQRKEYAISKSGQDYDPQYIERLRNEAFVVTERPNYGYKLGVYPNGSYKVGRVKQDLAIKMEQLGIKKGKDGEDAPLPFKRLVALEAYEPFNPEVLFYSDDKEDFFLNMYRPSIYMEAYRGYLGVALRPVHRYDQLDPINQAFFNHLLPDVTDRTYLIQWLAWSVFEQCETIPIMFGKGGTGKGVLASMWCRMLGDSNYTPMNAGGLSGDFSMTPFLNKRGVAINEGQITSPQQMENLKNSTDSRIRVNEKHEKARPINKTHSAMYTANYLNAMKGFDFVNERRFSFLGITDSPLVGARVNISNGGTVMFDRDTLNKIKPEKDPEGFHELTFDLFSFLANLYTGGKLDPSVKNVAHKNISKTKLIESASAPGWYLELEDALSDMIADFKPELKYSGFGHYISVSTLKDELKILLKGQNVPGYEKIIQQFEVRQAAHNDVLVKRGTTAKYSKIYFSDSAFRKISDSEPEG